MQIAAYIIAGLSLYVGVTCCILSFLASHRERQRRKNASYRAMQDDCWLNEVIGERAAFHEDRNAL